MKLRWCFYAAIGLTALYAIYDLFLIPLITKYDYRLLLAGFLPITFISAFLGLWSANAKPATINKALKRRLTEKTHAVELPMFLHLVVCSVLSLAYLICLGLALLSITITKELPADHYSHIYIAILIGISIGWAAGILIAPFSAIRLRRFQTS